MEGCKHSEQDIEDLVAPASAAVDSLQGATPQGKVDSSGFCWHRAWYPLVPLYYLDPRKPFALTVLGHKLVVWHDRSAGAWRCFEDRCPHRLAPLSEGRIDPATGQLSCSYHGWRFNGSGRCSAVPQADSARQEEVVRSSSRACVASYPLRVQQKLLWVWMDSSPGAAAESAARSVALSTELLDGSGTLLGDWYMRELPLSWEHLVENLLDPAHIHFAHHGVIGSRSRAGPLKLELQGAVTAQGGFEVTFRQRMDSATVFVPPCLTWLKLQPGQGRVFSLLFYAVPVSPGHSRIVAGYSTNSLPGPVSRVLQSGLVAPLVRAFQWVGDLGAHEVLDGDTLFLRAQEENLLAGGQGWKQQYFMPTASDRGVSLLRRWIDREGGGGPRYGPHAPSLKALPPLSRHQVLDRYSQHTEYCPSCRRALKCVRSLRSVLSLAATSSLAAGIALALSQPAGTLATLPAALGSTPALLVAGAAACGLLRRALGRLERKFVFTDYLHSEK